MPRGGSHPGRRFEAPAWIGLRAAPLARATAPIRSRGVGQPRPRLAGSHAGVPTGMGAGGSGDVGPAGPARWGRRESAKPFDRAPSVSHSLRKASIPGQRRLAADRACRVLFTLRRGSDAQTAPRQPVSHSLRKANMPRQRRSFTERACRDLFTFRRESDSKAARHQPVSHSLRKANIPGQRRLAADRACRVLFTLRRGSDAQAAPHPRVSHSLRHPARRWGLPRAGCPVRGD